MIGDSLLHYRILEKIGAGGMGVVYKALDTRLDRPVAIKTLPYIDDPKHRNQCIWEARATARLRHPNIVVVHDITSQQDREFIVMEYIPGAPLSERLARGPLPMEEALRYAKEIASALETAHEAGIVHRDLKPSNVLITPEGSIKLVDFGLARLQEQDGESQSALHGIAGTCGYMAPEQARGERGSARSDIFSFGAVLYEMVTGKQAFSGNSAASGLAAVLRDDPPAAASLVSDLPAALDRIIKRCLQKDPKRRFQHMGDVRLALEEVTSVSSLTRWPFRSFWRSLLYAALVTVLLLAGWLALHWFSETPANSAPFPLTTFPGVVGEPAWSPDGRQVAFIWDAEKRGNLNIYLLQPGSSQTQRLTTKAGSNLSPAWSPDGRWIAYIHTEEDESSYSLDLVSPLGGPTRTLLAGAKFLGRPNWTPDGRALLVEARPEKNRPGVLWAVWLATGDHQQLTWPPEGIPGDMTPAISPDGKALAFCRKTFWRTAELYLLDLKPNLSPAGTPRRLTNFGFVGWPAWTPDGGRILFEADRDGVGIWQVDRNGNHARPVSGTPRTASLPAVARRPDGHASLIFTNQVFRSSIWRCSTKRNAGGPPVELVHSTRGQTYPRYSNDGKRLAFSSTRSGYEEIWVANADGSQPVQLTDLRHQLTEVGDWSPTDDAIAFVSQDRGSRQIYMISSSGGPAIPVTNEDGVNRGTGWSRDGRGYYYESLRSDRFEVRKASRAGALPELMALNGLNGFESYRGSFYYWRQKPGKNADMTLRFAQGRQNDLQMMRRTLNGDENVRWMPPACALCITTPRPEGVYYRAQDSDDIYLFNETSGRSMKVLQRPPEPLITFTLSPDARWFAYSSSVLDSVELMIIENFH